MKTQLRYYFVLFCTLACYVTGYSQINYTQNFDTDEAGWSDTEFIASDYAPCDGMSLTGEAYYVDWGDGDIETGSAQTISPSLGTSNGLPVTINYSYKVYDYWMDEPLSNQFDWGTAVVSYATSASGPWTTLHTLNSANTTSVDCAVKTATFTPALGSAIYLRVTVNPGTVNFTDILFAFDNLSLIQQLPACTGTPAASSAVVLNGPVCAQQNASLALTPASTASGLSYQWQGSTNGTTYTNIVGATSATFNGSQAQGPWYRAVVTCTATGLSVTSGGVQATFAATACPGCNVEFISNVEPITSVVFSNLTNVSDASASGAPDIQNFTALPPANVTTGQAYTFSAQGNTDGNYTTYIKVYIDFNRNGNLNDPGESFQIGTVINSNGTDGITASAPIFIPTDALPGLTSMRVFKLFDAYASNPCGTGYGYGQIEDYVVNITQCTTAAPTAVAAQTFCANSTVANLVATGTAVKWYAAASGGAALPTTQALVNNTVYYASQTNVCEGSARVPVTAAITVVPADDPADVTNCGPYVLPALTNGVYRTAIGGGGTVVAAGTPITATTTLYVRGTAGACSIDNSVLITISNPLADDPADVSACGTYTLPALTNGAYRTAAAGAGTVVIAGTAITATTTLYVYAGSPTCNVDNSFTVTINNAVADDPADVVSCSAYVLPALTNGAYHTAAGGLGDTLAAGSEVSATTTLYVYNTVGTCSAENSFTVTINSFEVDELDDVTACGSYVLPALTTGAYFTGGSGLGTAHQAGDVITTTMTLHVYGVSTVNPACTDDNAFTVTIINTVADDMADVTTCSTYVLPALSANNEYYTGPDGTGTQLSEGEVIAQTTTIYVFAVKQEGIVVCTDETSFTVTFAPLENPGDITVTLEQEASNPVGYLLYDIDIEADYEGTITYYATEDDALTNANPLFESATVAAGTTIYYATLTDGGCTSEPFAVTFDIILGTNHFDMAGFGYYPNPVSDVLNLEYSENITGVEVFNLLGQKVISGKYNMDKVQLNLSQLASGTYMVKVSAENASKTIKVVKNK